MAQEGAAVALFHYKGKEGEHVVARCRGAAEAEDWAEISHAAHL